jgi:lysine-specific demethylase 3
MTTEPEHASQETLKDLAARRENDAKRNPTFLTCLKRKEHGAKDFSPMSRFNKVDLEEAISNMEQFLGNEAIVQPAHPVSPGSLPPDVAGSDDTSSTTIQTPPHRVHTPLSSPLSSAASDTTLISNGDQHEPPPTPSHDERTGVPYREIQRFADSQLKEEEFRAIWAKGDPLLVTGVGRKFKIDWSPSYFMKKYGSESCLIIDCQTDANKRITVKEFFSTFGQYEDRENCWKLKVSRILFAINPD